MQRTMLRLHIIAQKSKNQTRLAEAKKETIFWKSKFYALKKSSDEMVEQFEIEKDSQNDLIQEYSDKFDNVTAATKLIVPTISTQGQL